MYEHCDGIGAKRERERDPYLHNPNRGAVGCGAFSKSHPSLDVLGSVLRSIPRSVLSSAWGWKSSLFNSASRVGRCYIYHHVLAKRVAVEYYTFMAVVSWG